MNEPMQGRFADLLPRMQQIAASHAGVRVWAHPGQLAWSSIFTDPAAPAVLVDETAYAWFDGPGWLEIGGDPTAAKVLLSWAFERSKTVRLNADPDWLDVLTELGGVEQEAPWFTLQRLCLSTLGAPGLPPGYTVRHVEHGEVDARSAAHRAAWSDNSPSSVSAARYARLAATAPYDHRLDWVELDQSGEMVGSVIVWYAGGDALVEPVGVVPEHRGRGLAGALTLAALAAARDLGATDAIVRPRGDDDYPVPAKVYRSIGFVDSAQTWNLRLTSP